MALLPVPFITADQLVLHAIGDYVLQSDWMANTKTKKSSAALAHVVTYTLPWLCLTTSWKALLVILVSHFVIDRWRLARYICWIKNFMAPAWIEVHRPLCHCKDKKDGSTCDLCGKTELVRCVRNRSWHSCQATGYDPDRPAWMSVWLMIIADNTMHVICNALAIKYLG